MATRSLPLNYDIVVYSGTSYRREFRWLADGVNALDLSGWSARMDVGQPLNVADLELSTANECIELTSAGQIIVTMSPAQTAALVSSVTSYNLDLTEPDGFVRRFLRGRVSVVVDVRPVP